MNDTAHERGYAPHWYAICANMVTDSAVNGVGVPYPCHVLVIHKTQPHDLIPPPASRIRPPPFTPQRNDPHTQSTYPITHTHPIAPDPGYPTPAAYTRPHLTGPPK